MSAAAVETKALPNGNGSAAANGIAKNQPRVSKNARRRAKKKEDKAVGAATTASLEATQDSEQGVDEKQSKTPTAAAVSQSTSSAPSLAEFQGPEASDENFLLFKEVFDKFAGPSSEGLNGANAEAGPSKGDVIYSDDEDMSDSDASDVDGNGKRSDEKNALSRRKQKKLSRLTVAELKQMVKKPEVVDWSDVTSSDPRLLIQMKSTRNTVPVPAHWSQKREYLQNKRGIEKPAFELPAYIADTGIGTIKDSMKEKEADQTLKSKTRERVQPKMGKVVVDYQKLHDAFFRFQTKPPLSNYGETYYEGKEYETKFKERKPGALSVELKEALSIPPLAPPPWLIAMQRFGPPPSYPHLKISGLNAPIPDGAQWGFHPGGWGRPPMDEFGNPLYGDVLGQMGQGQGDPASWMLAEEQVVKEPWGELEPEESEEEEEEEEEGDEEDQEEGEGEGEERQGEAAAPPPDGLETPGGMASVASTIPAGLETPDFLELRKQNGGRGGTATPAMASISAAQQQQQQQRSLYQVLPETQTRVSGFMGSERGYDFSQQPKGAPNGPVLGAEDSRKRKTGTADNVQVALDPAELEGLSEAQLQQRFDEARRAQSAGNGSGGGGAGGEELSLLREELSRKRRATEERRRERGAGGGGGGGQGRGGGGDKFKF